MNRATNLTNSLQACSSQSQITLSRGSEQGGGLTQTSYPAVKKLTYTLLVNVIIPNAVRTTPKIPKVLWSMPQAQTIVTSPVTNIDNPKAAIILFLIITSWSVRWDSNPLQIESQSICLPSASDTVVGERRLVIASLLGTLPLVQTHTSQVSLCSFLVLTIN